MRILIVGDMHFRYQLPYSTALPDGRRSEWEAVKKTIHEEAAKSHTVVLMGDNFNSKHNHSSVNTEFIEFLNEFGSKEVYIIAGNHERYGEDTALDFIKAMDVSNWNVFTTPAWIQTEDDLRLQFVPYMTPGTLGAANNEEARDNLVSMLHPADYMFHHHILESTKWEGGDSSIVNELVLPKSITQNYKLIFGGHIHQSSKVSDNAWCVGNIFTNEVGEHAKYIFALDTDTNEVTRIDLPVRGIHKVDVTTTLEIPTQIPDKSIVKVTVLNREFQGGGVAELRRQCERFDSYVLIEQYSKQRKKINLAESGGLDFSIDNLLKIYCDQRKLVYSDIQEALSLIE